MKKSVMMDILACPLDKHHPLELFTISESDADVISEGVLYCIKCLRFYPIIEAIPILLPDDLRDQKQELEFLTKHSKVLPQKITASANPWHL